MIIHKKIISGLAAAHCIFGANSQQNIFPRPSESCSWEWEVMAVVPAINSLLSTLNIPLRFPTRLSSRRHWDEDERRPPKAGKSLMGPTDANASTCAAAFVYTFQALLTAVCVWQARTLIESPSRLTWFLFFDFIAIFFYQRRVWGPGMGESMPPERAPGASASALAAARPPRSGPSLPS